MINLDKIKTDVKQVLEYSQNLYDLNVDTLISDWYDAKSEFIKIFHGEAIYKYPEKIRINIDPNEQIKELNNFLAEATPYLNGSLAAFQNFIMANKDGFFKNITTEEIAYKDKIIPKGIKLTKAFKYFTNTSENLKILQILASQKIQKGKVTGYLYFSVHPLDYLSSSENDFGWRSCHSLDGEYKAGNLSYMCDKATVVCYLADEKNEYALPHFPKTVLWNSKKWRMLLFTSEDQNLLFAGRHYPFFSRELMELVRTTWFKNLFNISYNDSYYCWLHDSHWHDDYMSCYFYKENIEDSRNFDDKYYPIKEHLYPLKEIIKEEENPLYFNDLLHSSFYHPYYCWIKDNYKKIKPIKIGAKVTCPCCNSNYLTNSDRVFCDECAEDLGFHTCACCGGSIPEGEGIETAYGTIICQDCYEDDYFTCEECGEVFLYDERGFTGYYSDLLVCRDCAEMLEEKDK